MHDGQVLLLENVRFHKGETDNEPGFAAALATASCADVFVNDAFGTAHRAHASTAGVAAHVAHAVPGLLVQKELAYLERAVLQAPARPLVAVIGGAKVSTKIPVMRSLLKHCDTVVVVGGMAGTFWRAMGYTVGDSLLEEDCVPLAKEFIEYAAQHPVTLCLPTDALCGDQFSSDAATQLVPADSIPDGWMFMDIGPDSIANITHVLQGAETVLWNGPAGVFEFEAFAQGTNAIARSLARLTQEQGKTTVVGGGDSVYAINKLGLAEQVSHVSTGGGAALELLEGLTLPGIAALDDAN
eukprot:TRINITY_DN22108_c0_g1_i1.p1 TRINITY_DN22108_c0_g1~~TRINITY_DN22108_c0_g1_i1.p1  ORF type:complete len:298 (-),score=70.19 TRINITY_DN22108_c0_g1_i1:138-1031(-)